MKPVGSSAVGTSSIISNTPAMRAFIDVSASCHDFSILGYLYCRNTCLRTVTFATSPTETDKFVLRVTSKSSPRKSFDFNGSYYMETESINGATPEQRNTWIKKSRYFAPPLPIASYTAQFIDSRTGVPVWPGFVERIDERSACVPDLDVESVELLIPQPTLAQCRDLVRNGDMELSDITYAYWLHHDTGIELLSGAGIGGSKTIADTIHTVSNAYIGQFIDTRCLTTGRQYMIRAWLKLVNPQTKSIVQCNKSTNTCPTIQLRIRTAKSGYGESFDDDSVTVASSFVNTVNGWNLYEGVVTVNAEIDGADSVALVVRRGMLNTKMFLDNVSMTLKQ